MDAESVSTKENHSTEGGKCTTAASSSSKSPPVTETAETTERDDCESLALSDEKSLADSFTSLAPEAPEETQQGAAALLEQSNSQSLQNLDVQVENDPQFRRQTWETRSMTNLERVVTRPESKIHVSVGGWSEPSSQGITTKGSFVRKRDLWEKRASVTSSSPSTQLNLRQKHTPDLVMDLPPSLALSSSPKDDSLVAVPVAASSSSAARQRHESETSTQSSSSGSGSGSGSGSSNPSSPGSPEMTTAAETFARQNQSTLKKSHVVKVTKKEPAELPTEEPPAQPRSAPAVKLHIATYGSAGSSSGSSSGSTGGLSPAANPLTRPATTPKLGARFSHLYGTPMPVLPIAFAAQAAQTGATGIDSSGSDGRPQVKMKPQVLRKPMRPSLSSPESTRRSGVDQDSVV